jgi:hypothetical protein
VATQCEATTPANFREIAWRAELCRHRPFNIKDAASTRIDDFLNGLGGGTAIFTPTNTTGEGDGHLKRLLLRWGNDHRHALDLSRPRLLSFSRYMSQQGILQFLPNYFKIHDVGSRPILMLPPVSRIPIHGYANIRKR